MSQSLCQSTIRTRKSLCESAFWLSLSQHHWPDLNGSYQESVFADRHGISASENFPQVLNTGLLN